jgi:hypothetical protein
VKVCRLIVDPALSIKLKLVTDPSRLSKHATLKRARQYDPNDNTQPVLQHGNFSREFPHLHLISASCHLLNPSAAVVPPPFAMSDSGPSPFYQTSPQLVTNPTPYPANASNYVQEAPSSWSMPTGYAEPSNLQQSPPGPSVDPRFLTYSPPSAGPAAFNGSPGSTPPLPPPFDTTGLPFAGLDFLHNFTPAGYSGADDQSIEALWQNIGAGAFNFDPELQFALGDSSRNGTNASA